MDQLYLSNADLEKLAKLQNDTLVSITAVNRKFNKRKR